MLRLQFNALEGSLPRTLIKARNFEGIILVSNYLTGLLAIPHFFSYFLPGTLPPELFLLPKLTDLILPDNQLSGSIVIPANATQTLTTLYLSNNRFTGLFC